MLIAIGQKVGRWSAGQTPWTNVYGVARSLIAAATALTLALNKPTTLFRPVADSAATAPFCDGARHLALFCLLPSSTLEVLRWLAVALLVVVASGWRPRITGLIHWWIAVSFQTTAVTLDGGDQVAVVLTFLLLPVTLTDPRKWHWSTPPAPADERIFSRAFAVIALTIAIRLQVAAIYFHAAIGKMAVMEWVDGTALYYWLLHGSFGVPPAVAGVIRPWLLNGAFVSSLTWSVVMLEYFLSAALVMPRRWWPLMMRLGIALHLGIMILQGLGSFSMTMVAALILYLRDPNHAFSLNWFDTRERFWDIEPSPRVRKSYE